MTETGSIADYDRLGEALEQWDATRMADHGLAACIGASRKLVDAAILCGYRNDCDVLLWARNRIRTYQNHKDTVDHAVSRLNEVVKELEEEQ